MGYTVNVKVYKPHDFYPTLNITSDKSFKKKKDAIKESRKITQLYLHGNREFPIGSFASKEVEREENKNRGFLLDVGDYF